jgi:hypothetical protein
MAMLLPESKSVPTGAVHVPADGARYVLPTTAGPEDEQDAV